MIELVGNDTIALQVQRGDLFNGGIYGTFRTEIEIENISAVIENKEATLKQRRWNQEKGVHYTPEAKLNWKATIHKKKYDEEYECRFYTTEESFDDIIEAINTQLNRAFIKENNNETK